MNTADSSRSFLEDLINGKLWGGKVPIIFWWGIPRIAW